MLLKNILSFVCVLGMALAIPVNQKREEESEVITIVHTIDTKDQETAVVEENNDGGEFTTEVVVLTSTIVEDITDGVEIPDDDNEKKEDIATAAAEEEVVTAAAEEEDTKDAEEKTTKAAEEETTKTAEEESATATAEESVTPVNPEEETEAPFIPENEEPDVDTTVCSKDLLLMGNKVESHHVCDDIYDACTKKELISIIMYYYSKSSPVSIEYTINEGINKASISEQCGNILINSKIFQEETTVIEGDIENPDPAEKITEINQDIPTEAAEKEDDVKEEDERPELGDNYAEYSEDDNEENI